MFLLSDFAERSDVSDMNVIIPSTRRQTSSKDFITDKKKIIQLQVKLCINTCRTKPVGQKMGSIN